MSRSRDMASVLDGAYIISPPSPTGTPNHPSSSNETAATSIYPEVIWGETTILGDDQELYYDLTPNGVIRSGASYFNGDIELGFLGSRGKRELVHFPLSGRSDHKKRLYTSAFQHQYSSDGYYNRAQRSSGVPPRPRAQIFPDDTKDRSLDHSQSSLRGNPWANAGTQWAPPPGRSIQQTSCYWSVPEQTEFPALLKHFGTDWHGIAKHMTSKTPIMVKNYYQRQVDLGKMKEWEDFTRDTDAKRDKGEMLPEFPQIQPAASTSVLNKHLPPQPIQQATQQAQQAPRLPRGPALGYFTQNEPRDVRDLLQNSRPIMQTNTPVSERSLMVAQEAHAERQRAESALRMASERKQQSDEDDIDIRIRRGRVGGIDNKHISDDSRSGPVQVQPFGVRSCGFSSLKSTISQDNTTGDCARNARLLAEFGQKFRVDSPLTPVRISDQILPSTPFQSSLRTPSETQEGMLHRDIQRETVYYDFAAEKQLSQADAKLFYQRSQLEAQKTGSSRGQIRRTPSPPPSSRREFES